MFAVTEEHSKKDSNMFEPKGYNDKPFAIAFIAHICAVVAWVIYSAQAGSYKVLSDAAGNDKVTSLLQGNIIRATSAHDSAHFAVVLAFTSVAEAIAGGSLWLTLLFFFPKQIVMVALAFLPTVMTFLAVWSFVNGQIVGGVIFAVFAGMLVLWAFSVQDRIAFTGQLFKTVSMIYSLSPGIFLTTVLVMTMNAAWTVLWLFAVVPVYVADEQKLSEGKPHADHSTVGLGWVLLLLSFYWTVQVTSNLLHVSCSGLVGRWYFKQQMDAPVARATGQAFTNYFGSICFGSLLIATIQTMRALVQTAQQQAYQDGNIAGEICACCADCLLSMIEAWARFFNTYAMVMVAIWAVPFYGAGQLAMNLFERAGVEVIISYSLVNAVNGFGCFGVSALVCAVNAVLAWSLSLDGAFVAAGAGIGFLSGFAVMCVLSRIVESGCDSLFVCFAEQPKELLNSAGPLYEAFVERQKMS